MAIDPASIGQVKLIFQNGVEKTFTAEGGATSIVFKEIGPGRFQQNYTTYPGEVEYPKSILEGKLPKRYPTPGFDRNG